LNAPPEINVDSEAFDPELNRVRLAGAASAWLAKLVGKPAEREQDRNDAGVQVRSAGRTGRLKLAAA